MLTTMSLYLLKEMNKRKNLETSTGWQGALACIARLAIQPSVLPEKIGTKLLDFFWNS